MIKKIKKLKRFDIFQDFPGGQPLPPDFRRFNLIYGWNRSGKTTISRVFASCEKKCAYDEEKFKQYPENGEFEVSADTTTINNINVSENNLPIKVFNQDFVDDNVSFDPTDVCRPIVYISEADIKVKKQIDALEEKEQQLQDQYGKAKKLHKDATDKENKFRISVGQTITRVLTDKARRDDYYSYDKSDVEGAIGRLGIDNIINCELSEKERKKHEETNKSPQRGKQNALGSFQFSFLVDKEKIDSFDKIYVAVEKLLQKEVISETLERLKDDVDLNNWVKQGFDLHKMRGEKEKCLFCQKPLDSDFLDTLSKHFSQDYEKLQSSLSELKEKILEIKQKGIAVKNDELYSDFREQYTKKSEELNKCGNEINKWIDQVAKKLDEKYHNPLTIIDSPAKPSDFLASYNEIIKSLKQIIDSHNDKVENHKNEVNKARKELELDMIAVAVKREDYKKMKSDIEKAQEKKEQALARLNENKLTLTQLREESSDVQKAVPKINKCLEEFFGRKEIQIELEKDKKGYSIMRGEQPAKNLSESEKTAIAFSYFVVKVGERNFKKSEGIIFIDDPISSLDSNFIYLCFSMIQNHFKEVKQLFISTHNFQFFNLVKDWFIGKNKRKREEDILPCEFFMVESYAVSDSRNAKIIKLDPTLEKYKSEYHFLFAKLKCFLEGNNTQYRELYTIGNIARRFFDIFIDFKVPTTGNQKSRMNKLVKEQCPTVSQVDADKVYKLMNEYSHNYDPTSTIEHKDKSEAESAVKILLDIVKESDPKHYEELEKSITDAKSSTQ